MIAGTAVAALAAAIGSSAPSLAAPTSINGRYAIIGGSDQAFADASSSCATEGCKASLASNVGWTAVATLTGGRWNFDVVKPDGVICSDGNFADVVIRYSIDATTLNGYLTADSNGECPGGQVTQAPIRLAKVG